MTHSRRWLAYVASLLVSGFLYMGFVAAEPGEPKTPAQPAQDFELPKVLKEHGSPATVEELRAIEKHVQKVLDKVMPAVVGLRVGPGQGSGVIVKEDGFILTAGHVSGTPNQNAQVVMPNGKVHKGKSLGKNGGIDSGMMKILDEGKYPHLEMGKSSDLKVGQWVVAIGHPGGFRPNRTPVVRVGRILVVNQFLIRTDCTLVGGDSGGPLFDMQGRVIGIHSRIGGLAITENIHVPIDTFVQTWDKLAKGEAWGGQLGQTENVKGAGGKVVFEKKDSFTKEDPTDVSPKDQTQNSHFKPYTFRMKPGHTYTIDLISGDKGGKKLDTFLKLQHPDGKQIAEDDDGGGFPHSRIVYKAIVEGDYKIIATSFEPNQTGPFTLKISDADFVDAIVSGKVDVLRTIKMPQPAVMTQIEKFDAVKVPLHINAIVVDAKGQPLANAELTVTWEKGSKTFKSNNDGVVRWPLAKDKYRKLAMALPADTKALVALTDAQGQSIGLKFLQDPAEEKVKSAGGKVVKTFNGTIAKTDPFDVEKEKCFRHIHEFKFEVGKTYTLDLVSDDFDAYLRVENDDKGKIAEDDDGAGWLNSRIVFTPKENEAGICRLVVTTCDPGQIGVYRLTIRETEAKKAEPKEEKK